MIATHILVAVCCVAILALFISLRAGFQTTMDRYIRVFLGFLVLHAAHAWLLRTFVEVNIPSANFVPYGLLYGPFLFFAFRIATNAPIQKRVVVLHALPFLVFFGCYFLTLAAPSLFRGYERAFGFAFYGALSLSFTGYAIWALFFQPDTSHAGRNGALRLLAAMAVVLAFVAVVVSVFTYSSAATGPVRSQFVGGIVFLAMLAAVIVLFVDLVERAVDRLPATDVTAFQHKSVQPQVVSGVEVLVDDERYQKSAIPQDAMDAYEQSLRELVDEKRVYLDDQLSLGTLAHQLKIPKHHLSQVFSLRIGKNFNTYINACRVNHATRLMHAHPEMGIADVFLRSGFNAKASFNRYFKQIHGCTPTAYRNGLPDERAMLR